jgi:alpha-mannosidase
MRVNFGYIDRYPHYGLQLDRSESIQVDEGIFPCGLREAATVCRSRALVSRRSSVEEGDVNLPSAEGIFRQILYGNEYFRKDFGKASAEYMLPDCFGFPALLPSILAHAGVKGFSTQKLNSQWQPAAKIGGPGSPEDTPEGIPFFQCRDVARP